MDNRRSAGDISADGMKKRMQSFFPAFGGALLAAAACAFLMEVRGLFPVGGRVTPASLSPADAVPDQCTVAGGSVASTGNDAKLVWRGFSCRGGHLEIEADAPEDTCLDVFRGKPGQPGFSPDRKSRHFLFAGRNRVVAPLPGETAGLRLDFGREPGQTFRIRSIAVKGGPYFTRPWSWRTFFLRTVLLGSLFFLLALHAVFPAAAIWTFVDRNRFALAACILAFATVFELNGSSIGMWNRLVPNRAAEAPLFGEERPIRSDEWASFSPLTLAQAAARPAWPYFNGIPRDMPTDMFTVYAQPVRHPLVVFRPFLAGFVLFGFRHGLAFFWAGRWLALLLALYGLFKLLTGGDKLLSGAAAALAVFSPAVQWWGAINAFAEMLFSGSLFVLCLDRFMAGRNFRERWLPLLGMGYAGVAYAMTLYPAEMVPLAWVFAALSVWTVVRRAGGFRPDARSAVFAAVAVLAAAGCLAWYLFLSRESFRLAAETVYPGRRFSCGGGFAGKWGLSWGNLFFPWTPPGVEDGNPFNRSVFFDFFPLGYLLSAISCARRRKADLPSLLLAGVAVLLGMYCAKGLPPWAANLTLLSRSTTPRAFVAFGFAQFLLLVRAVSFRFSGPLFPAASRCRRPRASPPWMPRSPIGPCRII